MAGSSKRRFTLNPSILWNRYFSKQPWFELITHEFTEDGRVKIECDWNTPFIRQLAENGVTGETEEDYISQYIVLVSRIVAARLNEAEAEKQGGAVTRIVDPQEMADMEPNPNRATGTRFVR